MQTDRPTDDLMSMSESRISRQKEPTGYGRLAKRIFGWTNSLLATGIVLVAGIGYGRHVVEWWKVDAGVPKPDVLTDSLGVFGDETRPHTLEIGDARHSLSRMSVIGDEEAACSALVRMCQFGVSTSRPPPGRMDRSEREFLERIAELDPVKEGPGGWKVHQLKGSFPMVVGTAEFGFQSPGLAGSPVGRPVRRVVTWGLGVPSSENGWTLYTFQLSPARKGSNHRLPEVPVPPTARRTLALRALGGGAMIGFAGTGQPNDWIEFYEDWFGQRGWSAVAGWHRSGSVWHAHFRESDRKKTWQGVDVQFGIDAGGNLSGLLTIALSTTDSIQGASR